MRLSKVSLILIIAFYTASFFHFAKWKDSLVGGGDCFGYYSYLPAIFIHHDLNHLRYTIYARNQYNGLIFDSTELVKNVPEVYFFKTGTPVIKYTCGLAILESPAFFIAHLIGKVLKLPSDGFAPHYVFAVFFWNLIFVFVGFLILQKILSTYFSDKIAAISLTAIALGSGLYHFAVYRAGMSHGYLFTLYALLIYSTIRYHIHASWSSATFIGLSAGFIALIRPNEALAIFIPVLYGIYSPQTLATKVKWLFRNRSFYLAILLFALCALPQIAYWLYTTGHVFYYSYSGESFDFKHPHITEGLCGYSNGWFAYAPVMLLSIAGIPLMAFRKNKLILPLLIILPIHIYIIYSWWCWQYISGIGSRPMTELGPLLAIPLGFCLKFLWRTIVMRILVIMFVIASIFLQLFFNWKHHENLLWSEISTKTFYWQTLFKTKLNNDDLVVLDTNEKQPDSPVFKQLLYKTNFEDSVNTMYVHQVCGTGYYSLLVDDREMYYGIFECKLESFNIQPGDWIKVSFDACNLGYGADIFSYVGMNIGFTKDDDSALKYVHIRIQNKFPPDGRYCVYCFPPGATGKASFFSQVPYSCKPSDKLKVFTGNPSHTSVAIDNLAIEVWR